MGGKKGVCSSGPRGTWRAQFLLSPVGEAQCVPKGGGQGGGRQELCEQARLGGAGRWSPAGMLGGESTVGRTAGPGGLVRRTAGFLKSRSWGGSEGQPGSCDEDQGGCCPLCFPHKTSRAGGRQPLGGSLRREKGLGEKSCQFPGGSRGVFVTWPPVWLGWAPGEPLNSREGGRWVPLGPGSSADVGLVLGRGRAGWGLRPEE